MIKNGTVMTVFRFLWEFAMVSRWLTEMREPPAKGKLEDVEPIVPFAWTEQTSFQGHVAFRRYDLQACSPSAQSLYCLCIRIK
jgi:hypothetical protein